MDNLSKNEDLIIRWLNHELSDEELKQFEASKDFKHYQRIINETDSWKLPKMDIFKSFANLSKKKVEQSKKNGKSIFIQWQMGIAASLLLIGSFFLYTYFIKSDIVTFSTVTGQTTEVYLPDGSIVYLNAESEISYHRKTWRKKRTIRLKGNAYFDVEKGGTFEVSSNQGVVAVKGTEFEINDGREFYNVACLEGRVEVEVFDANKKVVLDSSDVVVFTHKKGLYRHKTTRGKMRSWANGKTSFTNTPLSQVFEAIQKQFDVDIDLSQIDDEQKFTGEFLHSNIDTALKMVCVPMQIDYTINDKKIVLKHSN